MGGEFFKSANQRRTIFLFCLFSLSVISVVLTVQLRNFCGKSMTMSKTQRRLRGREWEGEEGKLPIGMMRFQFEAVIV